MTYVVVRRFGHLRPGLEPAAASLEVVATAAASTAAAVTAAEQLDPVGDDLGHVLF